MTTGRGEPRGLLRRAWEFLRVLALRYYADGCLLHASALTYTTLLSIVPLMALMFAVLKGLGAQGRLEHWLLTRLGLSPEVTEQIVAFVEGTNLGTLTTLGVVALLFTAISVLGNVESSLNHIWRVRSGRVWWRKLSDYLSVVLLTPFLLLAAVGVTSFLAEQQTLRWLLANRVIGEAAAQVLRLVPYGFNVLALGIVYIVMPNRRPDFRAIAIAALAAGISWQLVQVGYVQLQIGVVRANLIYGALAQLPVTLVWIYVSWTIVLAGAEIAAVLEFGVDGARGEAAAPPRWTVGLQLVLRAAERFQGEGGGVAVRDIARELRFEPSVIEDAAERLRAGGVLIEIAGAPATYALARDPASITLGAVTALIESDAGALSLDPRVAAVLQRARHGRQAELAGVTLADLLAGPPEESARATPARSVGVVRASGERS